MYKETKNTLWEILNLVELCYAFFLNKKNEIAVPRLL